MLALWGVGADDIGNIDPDTLPISQDLKRRLNAWAVRFDEGLNWDDPAQPGPDDPTFAADGLRLAKELQAELGPDYRVIAQV